MLAHSLTPSRHTRESCGTFSSTRLGTWLRQGLRLRSPETDGQGSLGTPVASPKSLLPKLRAILKYYNSVTSRGSSAGVLASGISPVRKRAGIRASSSTALNAGVGEPTLNIGNHIAEKPLAISTPPGGCGSTVSVMDTRECCMRSPRRSLVNATVRLSIDLGGAGSGAIWG